MTLGTHLVTLGDIISEKTVIYFKTHSWTSPSGAIPCQLCRDSGTLGRRRVALSAPGNDSNESASTSATDENRPPDGTHSQRSVVARTSAQRARVPASRVVWLPGQPQRPTHTPRRGRQMVQAGLTGHYLPFEVHHSRSMAAGTCHA